jgi:cyclic pyranopterin phosphate synthase
LKAILRAPNFTSDNLKRAIIESMDIKPEKHEFNLQEQPVIFRYMNMTGG